MCGIFGYVGTKTNTAEMVLAGLKSLEYRGYDSWGIVVKENNVLVVDKHVGKIGNASTSLPVSSIGMGHTRWATHGGVTVVNAHPHLDCKKEVAIIHNGIVENFQEIKDDLLSKGHKFLSETDTEVIVHSIEEFLKTESFDNAVRKTFIKLRGLNAIVALHAPSSKIIAAKNGSPLIVGKSTDGFYIASDATGMLPYTRQLLFLKDNEMIVLGTVLDLYSLPDGKKLHANFETIDWKIEDATIGNYPHFMIKEIHEQPTVIRNIANNYQTQIEKMAHSIQNAQGTFLIAAGTAYHASLTGMYLFSNISKLHVNTSAASEFNYLLDFINKKSLIIALSQSGETIDVVEPLTIAKKKGAKIAALTNVLGSTIYRMADEKILLGAGPEKAVASTKAYSAKIAILLYLSFAMIHKTEYARELLLKAADAIEASLTDEKIKTIKRIAKLLSSVEHIYTIGRGVSFGTALEAALKIKEVSYIHTEGLAGGELKHGTIALVSKGTPCIVFAPQDETYEAMISNATEIKARGGIIIGISPQSSPVFDHWIEVPDVKEASILPQIIPAQLLSYFLALEKGNDPDKPRNLAKSVTVK